MKVDGLVRRRLSTVQAFVTDANEERRQAPPRWDLWRRASRAAGSHPVLADTTVAILVGVISTAWLVHHPGSRLSIWVVQAGLIVPLVWRRRYPAAVFALISAVALVQWVLNAELVADLALLVSLYTLASHRPRLVAAVAAAVVEVGAVMASLRWSLAGSWARSLVFLTGLTAAAVLLGANLKARRERLVALTERAERLERERDQQALIAVAAERARIAREMHDVIAHSLAVMISLADGATAKLRTEPERAGEAIANMAMIGRQALGDTRRLLGVLRADQEPDGLAPQPGVAQVEALLGQVRGTGLVAVLRMEGRERPLGPGLELTAYRIVQEATTNVLKHAVGATTLVVTLEYGDDVLEISVRDDGRLLPSSSLGGRSPASAGHGLAGMSERAFVYGGTVTAAPCGDGWLVYARLPVAPMVPMAPLAQVAPRP